MNAITVVAAFAVCQTAEVRYLDGSVIVMTFEAKDVELQTKYGKLAVPLSDIRRIDVGVQQSAADLKEFAAMADDLGSQTYKKREDATVKLLAGGPNAYVFVRSWKPPDLETQTRRAKIVRDFESSLSAEMMGRSDKTVVQTAEFTASGKLVGEDLMARSANFGLQAVKFNSIISIVVEQPTILLEVDAKNSAKWIDTELQIDNRAAVKFVAEGQVDLWPQEPGRYLVGPQGYSAVGLNSTFMAGQLIGRVGEKGTPFVVGLSLSLTSYESGKLQIQIVPPPWAGSDPVGTYRVRVRQAGK